MTQALSAPSPRRDFLRNLTRKVARNLTHHPAFRPALWIVLIALVLRLAFVLVLETNPDFSGGDANWYMRTGRQLVQHGKTVGPIQTPPLYLVFVGSLQHLVPGESGPGEDYTFTEMQVVRVLQSVMGAALCLFVYLLARRVFSERAGWLAGGIMAISPTLIMEAGNLASEGLFLLFMFGGLMLYVQRRPTPRWMILVGAVLGLATLTRAVFLLFPVVIAAHLVLTQREPRGQWRRLVLALLLTYGAFVSTWTIYNAIIWDRLVIGGEGFMSMTYQGAEGKASPHELDQALDVSADEPGQDVRERREALREGVIDSVFGDPVGWLSHRVKELAKAYLQPHNTVLFGGKSVKTAMGDWLREDRSLDGLVNMTRLESFWPKLLLYAFHFAGLLLGTAGLVLSWRRWRDLLPVWGVIAYFTGVHVVLLALPRYLIPTYPVYWMFAALAVVMVWERWQRRRVVDSAHAPETPPVVRSRA